MRVIEQGRWFVNALWEPRSLTKAITLQTTKGYLEHDARYVINNKGRFPLSFMSEVRHFVTHTISTLNRYLPVVNRTSYRLCLYPPERTAWPLRNGSAHSEGSCDHESNTIYVALFTAGKVFDDTHYDELLSSIGHERHHLARGKITSDTYLFEHLVTEGLAIHFYNEVCGKIGLPKKYTSPAPVSPKEMARLRLMARDEYAKEKNYRRWFTWGDYIDGIPGGVGYVLGYDIVSNYLKHNLTATPSSLVGVPAKEFYSEGLLHESENHDRKVMDEAI